MAGGWPSILKKSKFHSSLNLAPPPGEPLLHGLGLGGVQDAGGVGLRRLVPAVIQAAEGLQNVALRIVQKPVPVLFGHACGRHHEGREPDAGHQALAADVVGDLPHGPVVVARIIVVELKHQVDAVVRQEILGHPVDLGIKPLFVLEPLRGLLAVADAVPRHRHGGSALPAWRLLNGAVINDAELIAIVVRPDAQGKRRAGLEPGAQDPTVAPAPAGVAFGSDGEVFFGVEEGAGSGQGGVARGG